MHQNFRLNQSTICVARHSVRYCGRHIRQRLCLFAQMLQLLFDEKKNGTELIPYIIIHNILSLT